MTAAPGPQQPDEGWERDAITDSRLAGEPGPWSLIVDCTVHGEIGRVPAGGSDEMGRVDAAWSQHLPAAPSAQPDEWRSYGLDSEDVAHEFEEDPDDASMCMCGVPALVHDEVMARRLTPAQPVRDTEEGRR